MWTLYSIAIFIYLFFIRIASLFNQKAKKWVEGRKNIFETIRKSLPSGEKRIWFHCPSYGEYEQGKPVLDEIKKSFPDFKIVLTFFSPSGFEKGKKDKTADYVFYLPMDSKKNAKQFLDIVRPVACLFVKYDFWYFYISELYRRKIPCYYFSCNFRSDQYFFKWYGSFFARQLSKISHFFVQNEQSASQLKSIHINNVTISGDTRFDRVFENYKNFQSLSLIEKFCSDKEIFVAGSTWEEDERIVLELIKQKSREWKFILVPHEINDQKIHLLQSSVQGAGLSCILYSELASGKQLAADVLIINSVGILSRVYHYATVSYVGGGFGKGIHNTLEVAVFGSPVLFGPNYKKFSEAIDLIEAGGAFCISDASGLLNQFHKFNSHPELLKQISEKNVHYIKSKKGATKIILDFLHKKA